MNEIDIVIPWVNPEDDVWFNDYKEACNKYDGDKHPARIRDFGIFNYWFRAVETNMPWVRYIHLFMYSETQIPKWLNINNSKLKIHFHREIIPEKYLPTFNSNIFFRYIYKLKDLSENFIYFNDDIIPFNYIEPSDYFENNIPKDCSIISNQINANPIHERILNRLNVKWPRQYLDPFLITVKNSLDLCKKYTSKFNIYRNPHIGIAALKSEVEKIFTDLDDDLNNIFIDGKFRKTTDVVCGWMYRYIRLNLGNFKEQDLSKLVYTEIKNENFYKELSKLLDCKMICLNDILDNNANIKLISKRLNELLNVLFPNKSGFEK